MTNILKFIKPSLEIDKNIAIVGSSATLLKSNSGKEIDEFSEVVRFNRAPTTNYENFVGAKTSYRIVNNHVFDNLDLSNRGYSNQPKNFVRKLRNKNIIYIGPDIKPWRKRFINTHYSNNLFLFDYRKISEVKRALGISHKEHLQIGTIFIGLCIISNIVPTLYGFDLEPIKRTHYFEDRPGDIDSLSHKISSEISTLIKLKSSKKIIVN